jgi:ketosteroid isomerase-like protein
VNPRIAALFACAAALAAGCSRADPGKLKAEVIAADRAFCAAAQKDGVEAAFLGVVADDGKLLGDDLAGADAVRDSFGTLPPAATLTWEPSFADVSASGELGYTWGRYTLNLPGKKEGNPKRKKTGTYVTVWRRQAPGGPWKVVLDGGTPDSAQ